MGVLAFSFLEAADAKMWVDEYYSQFKTNCRPIGHAVNPNFNLFTALGVHQDDDVAADRFLEGLYFFQFMINHYYKTGQTSISHKPGRTNLWQHFLESRQTLQESADNMEEARQLASSRQAIGSIERVRKRLRDLRDAGVDHVTFLMQMGKTKHEHICESLELFGKEILPEFLDDDEKRVKAKEVELAPYVEKAFERIGGRRMTHVPDEAIPNIEPKLYVGWGQKTDVILGMKTTSTDA